MSVIYSLTSCSPNSGVSMAIPHVPGSPYITLNVTGSSFELQSGSGILSVNGEVGGFTLTGDRFEITIDAANPRTWVLYSLVGNITLSTEDGITVMMDMGTYALYQVLRLAILPTQTSRNVLDSYKNSIPISGRVGISFTCNGKKCTDSCNRQICDHEGQHSLHGNRSKLSKESEVVADQAIIQFQWVSVDATGTSVSEVLMMTLPHHLNSLDTTIGSSCVGWLCDSERTYTRTHMDSVST
eukprot:TRINITY_DN4493_c0_g2_i4.p1 TRINITY_DN4493_c0_g2~~TRINITY_DN4493_c0_g2_i4.p1  ORF type:complete len:241 (+),score=21.00 TRINITY_DN4493_c0_g2_i4:618-1340(+)